jgi:hypothetical protein
MKYRSASILRLFHIVKFYTGLCNIGYCLYDSTFACGFKKPREKGRVKKTTLPSALLIRRWRGRAAVRQRPSQ